MKFFNFFYFCGSFCPPGSGSRSADLIESVSIRIRIRHPGYFPCLFYFFDPDSFISENLIFSLPFRPLIGPAVLRSRGSLRGLHKIYRKLPETTIFLSLGPHKGRWKLQKKPSALKRDHPALQNMKFLNFSTFVAGSFWHSWIRIR